MLNSPTDFAMRLPCAGAAQRPKFDTNPGESKMRREASLVLATAALVVSLNAARAEEPIDFKVGISSASVTVFPLWMAQDAGLFGKEGLNVQIVSMEGGSRGLQVLLSGEIQVMNVGLSPVVEANRAGADFRLIASSANSFPFSLYSSPDVNSAQDLKGAKVGISTFGSESEIALNLSLKQLGLSRDDVTVVQMGGTPQRMAAMLSGAVKATPLLEPASSIGHQKGLKLMVDLVAAHIPWAFDEVWVNASYLAGHRDILTRFLKAYIAADYLARSDPVRAKALLARTFKLTDAAVIDATFESYERVMPENAAPSSDAVANVLATLPTIGVDPGSKKAADYIDAGLIESLRQDGFIASLQRQYPKP
jgi:NitT/TauT family transport system substrate-binding protein